jgi:hypothetical protein
MMLFIPFTKSTHYDPSYQQKILFNHNQFNGEGAAFIIGGLKDLQTTVTVRNGKAISLHMLLKGLPASQGISCPFLFQHIEPNSSGMVTMAIYQKIDHDLIIARQSTLEKEIRHVIKDDKEKNIFSNPDEGIWFGSVFKNKMAEFAAPRSPREKTKNMPITLHHS